MKLGLPTGGDNFRYDSKMVVNEDERDKNISTILDITFNLLQTTKWGIFPLLQF